MPVNRWYSNNLVIEFVNNRETNCPANKVRENKENMIRSCLFITVKDTYRRTGFFVCLVEFLL